MHFFQSWCNTHLSSGVSFQPSVQTLHVSALLSTFPLLHVTNIYHVVNLPPKASRLAPLSVILGLHPTCKTKKLQFAGCRWKAGRCIGSSWGSSQGWGPCGWVHSPCRNDQPLQHISLQLLLKNIANYVLIFNCPFNCLWTCCCIFHYSLHKCNIVASPWCCRCH